MITFLPSWFRKTITLFIFFVAIIVANNGFAQVKFSVVCPEKTIGKNDLLQIQFKVENGSNVESINPPAFQNFVVVSGPNQQSSMSSINGKVSQYVAMGFSLKPLSAGRFTISSATAIVDGKKYQTTPIVINVTNSSSPQSGNSANLLPFANFNLDFPPLPSRRQFDDYILKPGENVVAKTEKNLFVKLEVSKTSCFVGEPITAAFKLYSRLHSETTITDAPSFNGFSVSDLDVDKNASVEKYNGRMYNVYTLRKVELYPLQAGDIVVDPVVADNKVTFIKSEYANSRQQTDFFDMLENFGDAAIPSSGLVEQNLVSKTAPLTIKVKPLPKNVPAGFKGAVGKFSISSSLEKNNISTTDAGVLKVTITGKGNIQLVNAPDINWPQNVDGYDAKVKDNVNKMTVPMEGSKTFSFPFTVSKPGDYLIDSIVFSYFDLAGKEYKILKTSPLQVHVSKGIANKVLVKNPLGNGTGNELISKRTEWILGIVLTAGIIFLILFLLIRKNKSKDYLEKNIKVDDIINESEEEKKFTIPESPLTAVHEKLIAQNSTEFFHTLDIALKKYLSEKLHVPSNELSKKRLNEELDRCNVGLNTSLMLNSLLEEIEINLYTPPSNTYQLNRIFEKASEVISLLDKQVCK